MIVRSSFFRVYQPLAVFSTAERGALAAAAASSGDAGDRDPAWLLVAELPEASAVPADGAYVRDIDGDIFVCPRRTRVRMLVGLLSFRGSLPDEVAEAFVPESEARRALFELAALGADDPTMRSHILHANWHVPLRWFAAFAPDERILTEDRSGLRIRYETRLDEARRRLARALTVLEDADVDASIVAPVRELESWLEGFHPSSVVELDYGSVAGIFDAEALVDDRSGEDVWTCLDALETGDELRAGRLFAELSERWAAARVLESVN